MENNPPQGKPSLGKCALREKVVQYNTPPLAGVDESLPRSESIVVTN